MKKLCEDVGFPIFSYNFFADLAVPQEKQQQAVDEVKRLLDKTAVLGASHALTFPMMLKDGIENAT